MQQASEPTIVKGGASIDIATAPEGTEIPLRCRTHKATLWYSRYRSKSVCL